MGFGMSETAAVEPAEGAEGGGPVAYGGGIEGRNNVVEGHYDRGTDVVLVGY